MIRRRCSSDCEKLRDAALWRSSKLWLGNAEILTSRVFFSLEHMSESAKISWIPIIDVRKKRPFWALSNLNLFTPRSPLGVGFPCCVAESLRAKMRWDGHDVQHATRINSVLSEPHLFQTHGFFFCLNPRNDVRCAMLCAVCMLSWEKMQKKSHHMKPIWNDMKDGPSSLCPMQAFSRTEAYISKPDEWFLKLMEPPAEGNRCPEFLRGIWWMKETWRHVIHVEWSLDV